MKIISVETRLLRMKLTASYTIAYETVDTVDILFMRIETDKGIIGSGCGAPTPSITGEMPEMVYRAAKELAEPILMGADPLRSALLLNTLKSAVPDKPSLTAMVDMALYDIRGKVAGLPLFLLMGGFREKIKTSITIGIMSEVDTLAKAAEFVKQGFKVLKIKGGTCVHGDIARVMKVREKVGNFIQLLFDANQGYTVSETLLFCKKTAAAGLELIEQPTPANEPKLLGRVKGKISIPVMADESLMNSQDALACVGLVDMVNIKLMKCGGISEALQINAIACAAGQGAMVGCMDEPALAIAAGLHFALARPNVVYADLDGHLDLAADPTAGAVRLEDGFLYPNMVPGLGFTLD